MTACNESLTDNSGTYPCLHRGPHGEHLVRMGGELLAWPNDDTRTDMDMRDQIAEESA